MQMIMPRHTLSHWQIFDDAMIFIWRKLEDVLALVKFYPSVPGDNVRMLLENEEVVLFRDEVVGVVVPDNPPILPLFNRGRLAHRTSSGYTSRSLGLILFL